MLVQYLRHKEEYMDKLFREAVEIYQTQSYPLG